MSWKLSDLVLTYDHNKKLNKPSVCKPAQFFFARRRDRTPALLCTSSNGSACKERDLFQHSAAQLHLWISLSIGWQAVLNRAAYPATLLIALISDCIHHLSMSLAQADIAARRLAVFNWAQWWSLLAHSICLSPCCKYTVMCTWPCVHGSPCNGAHRLQACICPLSPSWTNGTFLFSFLPKQACSHACYTSCHWLWYNSVRVWQDTHTHNCNNSFKSVFSLRLKLWY